MKGVAYVTGYLIGIALSWLALAAIVFLTVELFRAAFS